MIIPGILEETIEKIQEKVDLIKEAAELIQIDIADGILVEGHSFTDIQKITRLDTNIPLEIHFMVEKPSYLIALDGTKIPNVYKVCTQILPDNSTKDFILSIRELGYLAGVSVNFDEDVETLKDTLDYVDYIQFMSVLPGKQGNAFIPSVFDKINSFRNKYPFIKTQIDGGISTDNIQEVVNTGVDNIVIGSAIFNSEDPAKELLKFQTVHGRTNIS